MTQAETQPDAAETRLKRLRFRAWHRGIKEMDIILGSFADKELAGLGADDLDRFEALLEVPDTQLYNWVSGREPVEAAHDHDLFRRICAFEDLSSRI